MYVYFNKFYYIKVVLGIEHYTIKLILHILLNGVYAQISISSSVERSPFYVFDFQHYFII